MWGSDWWPQHSCSLQIHRNGLFFIVLACQKTQLIKLRHTSLQSKKKKKTCAHNWMFVGRESHGQTNTKSAHTLREDQNFSRQMSLLTLKTKHIHYEVLQDTCIPAVVPLPLKKTLKQPDKYEASQSQEELWCLSLTHTSIHWSNSAQLLIFMALEAWGFPQFSSTVLSHCIVILTSNQQPSSTWQVRRTCMITGQRLHVQQPAFSREKRG